MENKILMGIVRDIMEAKTNRKFRSACYKNSQPDGVDGFDLRKESKYQSNVIFAFTLIQGINHKN